jgi:hypothetical protein
MLTGCERDHQRENDAARAGTAASSRMEMNDD